MTKRTTPTIKLRNRILATITVALLEWVQGGAIDVAGVHATLDHLIDETLAEDARRREGRRHRQVAELLRGKR